MKQHIIIEENENIKFKPTVQWMQENYDKANRELFGGQLGECIFRAEPIKSNTHWLGSFRIDSDNLYVKSSTRRMYIKDYWGEQTFITHDNFFELCQPIITLSTYYSGTQESLYATLVHEMCHYYTYMDGYCPKQGHGPEFRNIGSIVAYRSNGALTVQRIASAEQMSGYDLDDAIKQRQEKRAAANRVSAHYYLIVWKSGRVGIINPTDNCLRNIIGYEQRSDSKVKEILDITDPAITNELYEKYEFTNKMRAYRFWAERAGITQNTEIIKRILNNPNTHKIILDNE